MTSTSFELKHPIHDNFFKQVMTDPRVVQGFFKTHLPADLAQVIEWDSIIPQNTHFIDDRARALASDVLFQARLAGQAAYLYLVIEHQSRVDRWMPVRMLRYVTNILFHHTQQYPQFKKLPLVVPFVLYHGKRAWTYPIDLRDLTEAPKELIDQYLLKPFQLIDLTQIEDETLKREAWSAAFELSLKHIFKPNMRPWVNRDAPDSERLRH